jgi:hypothetical protein
LKDRTRPGASTLLLPSKDTGVKGPAEAPLHPCHRRRVHRDRDPADQFGFTPTGFCAQAALDAACHLHTDTAERMEHESLGNLQAELFQARITLNQLGAELEDTRNDPRAWTDDLDKTIARAAHALTDIDGAISRIHRRLARRCTSGGCGAEAWGLGNRQSLWVRSPRPGVKRSGLPGEGPATCRLRIASR